MTLDEAIKHCEEIADNFERTLARFEGDNVQKNNTCACMNQHRQLAEWLKELKDYREGTRTCENCKHELKSETEYPCSICRCNHVNKFEWKDGVK